MATTESAKSARDWMIEHISQWHEDADWKAQHIALAEWRDAAVAEERERCAKVVDGYAERQDRASSEKNECDAKASAWTHMLMAERYRLVSGAIRERIR